MRATYSPLGKVLSELFATPIVVEERRGRSQPLNAAHTRICEDMGAFSSLVKRRPVALLIGGVPGSLERVYNKTL